MKDGLRFKLCPPLFKLNGIRIDEPTNNLSETYRQDADFFKRNRQRRLHLRTADFNEFDIEIETVGEWLELPRLHVLVTQLSVGVHFVTPLYRGTAFFDKITTDSEIILIAAEMARRGGIDEVEFEQFELKHNARIKASRSTATGIVH